MAQRYEVFDSYDSLYVILEQERTYFPSVDRGLCQPITGESTPRWSPRGYIKDVGKIVGYIAFTV